MYIPYSNNLYRESDREVADVLSASIVSKLGGYLLVKVKIFMKYLAKIAEKQ